MPKYRTQQREPDAEKLDYLQKNIGLPSIREHEFYNPRYTQQEHKRKVDLFINNLVVCETDTIQYHGPLDLPNKNTLKRNLDHFLGGYPFFVINEDLANHLKLDQAKLGNYLYYHSLMYFKALEESREVLNANL